MAWSPDGARLATAGSDGTARIWEPGDRHRHLPATAAASCTAAVWSPDGDRLADGASGIRTWPALTTPRVIARPLGHPTELSIAGGTPSIWAPYLAAASSRRQVPRNCGSSRHRPAVGESRPVCASGRSRAHTGWIRAAAWSPDGTLLATVGDDRRSGSGNSASIRWLGRIDRAIRPTLAGHTTGFTQWPGRPTAPASPPGAMTERVRLWEPGTGRRSPSLTGALQRPCVAVAWSPDGTRLASTGADRTPPALGSALRRAPWSSGSTGHAGTVHSVGWSPDGAHLATADRTGLVIVWDRRAPRGHLPAAQAVAVPRLVGAL